jgi:hypothetical protein
MILRKRLYTVIYPKSYTLINQNKHTLAEPI